MGEAIQLYASDSPLKEVLDSIKDYDVSNRHETTQATDKKTRPGKGGEVWSYADIGSFYEWLDRKYPGWSFEVDVASFQQTADCLYVAGTLTVICKEGLTRKVKCYGSKEAIYARETGKIAVLPYLKAAETDALKRCCVRLGAFNDIYADVDDVTPTTVEDLEWYATKVLPSLLGMLNDKYTADKLFSSIMKFYSGETDKAKIVELLGERFSL